MPISNEPNYKQETSRVRTPLEGKRDPIIRLFVDMELGQSIGCARNCLLQARKFGYAFLKSEKQSALTYEVLGDRHREDKSANSDDAQFKPHRSAWDTKPSVARTPMRRL